MCLARWLNGTLCRCLKIPFGLGSKVSLLNFFLDDLSVGDNGIVRSFTLSVLWSI
jgi:hypothetical protein